MGSYRRVAFIGGAYVLSCLKPTEFTLSIKTNVPCAQLEGIEISIGALGTTLETAEPSAVTQCTTEGDLGSLVLTPGEARESGLGVRVVAGFKGPVGSCKAPGYGPNCIVARRAVRYVEHTPLFLPIVLDGLCAGIRCEPADTCYQGRCVPAGVDPNTCKGTDCAPSTPQWSDCGDPSAMAANAAWPMSFGCPTHTRASPFTAATKPVLRWKYAIPTGNLASVPATDANGDLWLGEPSGEVVCLDGKTGLPKRRPLPFDTANGVSGNGVITPDGFFVVNSARVGGFTGGFSVADGTQQWKLPYKMGDDATVGAGGLVFTLASDQMLALVPATGEPARHTRAVAENQQGLPPTQAADGWTYVVSGVNSLAALAAIDPLDTLRWQSPDLGKPAGTPAIYGDHVYIVDPNGVLLAFDRHTGAANPNWHVQTDAGPWATLAIGHDGVIYTSQKGVVVALDGGAVSWSLDVGGALQSPLIDGSNALIGFVAATKQVVAIDLASHTKRLSVDAGILGFSGNANDIVLNNDGTLVLFGGSGLWALGY